MHDESLAWIQETDPALMCTLQGIYAYKRRLRARKPSGRPDVKTTFGKFRFYSPKSPIDLCEVKVSKPRLSDNSMYPGLGEDFELPLAGTGDIKADLNFDPCLAKRHGGKLKFFIPKLPIDLCEVSMPRLSDNSTYPGLGEDFELPLAGTGDVKADLNCDTVLARRHGGKFRFFSPKSPIDLCEMPMPRLSDNSTYPGLGEDFELPLAGTGDIKADLNCERRFDSRSSNSEKSAPPPASESAKLLEEMSHIVKILRAFSCSEPTVDCKVQSTSTTFKGDRKMWCTEATRYTRVLS